MLTVWYRHVGSPINRGTVCDSYSFTPKPFKRQQRLGISTIKWILYLKPLCLISKPGNLAKLKAVNLAARKEAKSLSIGNGKYVKVSSYRKEPYVNIRDYAISALPSATKREILLKLEEWKQLKKCDKEVDQELKQTV